MLRKLKVILPIAACLAPSSAFGATGDIIAGTAFFYNGDGDMFTNRHVVDQCDQQRILVKTSDGRVSLAQVIAVSEESDLAAVTTSLKQNEFASIRVYDDGYISLPDQTEDVFTAGYSRPFENSFTIQLKWGQIQGDVKSTGTTDASSFVNIARMNVDHGASGSAVLDYSGLLIGIVYARSLAPVDDPNSLSASGYGDKMAMLHNNNAIVAFANKHALKINAWSEQARKNPEFILRHLERITAIVICPKA